MLTIGYIGNGKSTNRYHLPFVLQRKETFCVKTIYERNAKHRKWDTLPNVHYTSDIDELLNDPHIDLIVVCTSQDSHYQYAHMVLEHQKHVLVEKPFMMTYQEAKINISSTLAEMPSCAKCSSAFSASSTQIPQAIIVKSLPSLSCTAFPISNIESSS